MSNSQNGHDRDPRTVEAAHRLMNFLFDDDADAVGIALISDAEDSEIVSQFGLECALERPDAEFEELMAEAYRAVSDDDASAAIGNDKAVNPAGSFARATARVVEVWHGFFSNWQPLAIAAEGQLSLNPGPDPDMRRYFGFKLPVDELASDGSREPFAWMPKFLNIMGSQTGGGRVQSIKVSAYEESAVSDGAGALLLVVSDEAGRVEEFILTARNRSASVESAELRGDPDKFLVSVSLLHGNPF
jgi:hypothetical protein